MRYQAVLFDFNGTLSLDEEMSQEAWAEAFGLLGVEWSRERFFGELVGHHSEMIAFQAFLGATGEEPSRAWLEQALEARLAVGSRAIAAGETIADETVAVVRHLSELAPLALVTSAPTSLVLSELGAVNLLPCFTAIVAQEDVHEHKPSPAPYLLALEHLGVEASVAVAVEDSRPGALSALGAGLEVILIGGEWAPRDLPYRGHVESVAEPAFLDLLGIEALA
jgi:HAD superfamily hydrolase (TIGR01509 family)